MADVKVHNMRLEEVGSASLPDGAYDYPLKRHLLFEAVRHYLASGRAGTHKTKNRVEVAGGGRKPWKQKGTGRARVGSTRSPLWRKGGIVFGPQPRDYSYAFPRKARRRALASALSDKLREGKLFVLDAWSMDEPKTKALHGILRNDMKLEGKVLVLFDGESANTELAARNIPSVEAMRAMQAHAYHVLDHDVVVISRAAAEELGEVLTR